MLHYLSTDLSLPIHLLTASLTTFTMLSELRVGPFESKGHVDVLAAALPASSLPA